MINYKLTSKVINFKVKDRKTICNSTYELVLTLPNGVFPPIDELNNQHIYSVEQHNYEKKSIFIFGFKVESKAKCSPDDNFDYVLGQRITESRNEIKALSKVNKVLTGLYNQLNGIVADLHVAIDVDLATRTLKNQNHIKELIG